MSQFETLIYEKKENIAYITLNRPQALNVYNLKMRDELYEILGAVKLDNEVAVAVLQGAGEKAFCAGADLSEFLTAPPPVFARKARFDRDVWGLFLSLPQPVIVALHGFVLGSGLEMALCSDIRIAAANTQFGLPEVAIGIIPAAGATQTLPRVIGRAKTLEMLLNGSWMTAAEAYQVKLVNSVVPREELLPKVEQIAGKLAAFSPAAVRMAKQAIIRGRDLPLAEGLKLEKRLVTILESGDLKL
jgi:enoyl-CoA hydratase